MKKKFKRTISKAFLTMLATVGMVGVMTGCKDTKLVDEMTASKISSASINACVNVNVPIVAKSATENTAIDINGNWVGAVAGLDTSSYDASANAATGADVEAMEVSADDMEFDVEEDEEFYEDDEFYDDEFYDDPALDIEVSGNASAAIEGSLIYSFADDEVTTTNYDRYYETFEEDGDAVYYDYDYEDEEWYYESVIDEDISYYISGAGFEKAKLDTRDIWYKANKKLGSKTIDGHKCSVLELKATPDDAYKLLSTYVDAFSKYIIWDDYAMELEDMFGIEINQIFEVCPLTFRAYVDKESKVLMGIEVECKKFNKGKYLEYSEMTKEDFDDMMGFEVSSIKVGKALLSIYLSQIDTATVTIPEEVHQVYEDSLVDFGDFDFGGLDYEEVDDEDEEEDVEETTDTPAKKEPKKQEKTENVSADDVEEEEEEDEDWDDEDEEEDEDRSDATTADLLDENGNKIATVSVPTNSGFGYYPDYSDAGYVDFMTLGWEKECMVSSTIDGGYATVDLEDYLLYSDDEDYEPEVNYTKEAFSIGQLGGTAYYVEGHGGEDGDEYYIVVPFNDPDGEPNYITVSFYFSNDETDLENSIPGWSKDDYINLGKEIFG